MFYSLLAPLFLRDPNSPTPIYHSHLQEGPYVEKDREHRNPFKQTVIYKSINILRRCMAQTARPPAAAVRNRSHLALEWHTLC